MLLRVSSHPISSTNCNPLKNEFHHFVLRNKVIVMNNLLCKTKFFRSLQITSNLLNYIFYGKLSNKIIFILHHRKIYNIQFLLSIYVYLKDFIAYKIKQGGFNHFRTIIMFRTFECRYFIVVLLIFLPNMHLNLRLYNSKMA